MTRNKETAPTRPSPHAAAIAFAVLLIATIGAFAWVQLAKRSPLVLDRVTFVAVPGPSKSANRVGEFSPPIDCPSQKLRIRFRTTVSDAVTVQVVKPKEGPVITLARDKFLKRYHYHTFYWNGHRRGGGVVRPGHYKLRVKLLGEGRTLVPPGVIRVYPVSHHRKDGCMHATRG